MGVGLWLKRDLVGEVEAKLGGTGISNAVRGGETRHDVRPPLNGTELVLVAQAQAPGATIYS